MWNFGSGSYGTEEAKAKIKGEKFHKHSKKRDSSEDDDHDLNDQKCTMTRIKKPRDIEDDFGDIGNDEY